MKVLKKEEEQIKDELLKTGQKIIFENKYVVLIKDAERLSLDLDRVVEELGEEWYQEHQVTTYFFKFEIEDQEDKTI